jgi:hemerythrin superfamily protein
MTVRPEAMPQGDVIDLLLAQHQEIRRLFTETGNARGGDRRESFDNLRRLLAVHETAEEQIVHPEARRTLDNGDEVVDARLDEENQAKRMLEDLERVGPDAPNFEVLLEQLEKAVVEHAEHEERDEFPPFRERHPAYQREAMGKALKVAEALAPTHPHAGVESATANTLVGPYAAMLDRSRDVLSGALKRLAGD